MQCFYCLHYDDCTADKPGELVECQMENPSEPHYGDACEVAHTGKNLRSHEVCQKITFYSNLNFLQNCTSFLNFNFVVDSRIGNFWWRGCRAKHEEQLICTEQKLSHNDHEITYDECLCDTNECNREMGPIVTPTTSTSTIGKHIDQCCNSSVTFIRLIVRNLQFYLVLLLKIRITWNATIVLAMLVPSMMIVMSMSTEKKLFAKCTIQENPIMAMFVL